MEKIACTHQGEKLCTLGTVTVLAQGDGDDEETEFWDYLKGGSSSGSSGGDKSRSIGGATKSRDVGLLKEYKPKLFLVDSDPTKELKQVGFGELIKRAASLKLGGGGGFLNRSSLDDSNVFLLDTGWKIFIWVGKAADSGEKVAALGAADQYAEMEPRARELPVTVLKGEQHVQYSISTSAIFVVLVPDVDLRTCLYTIFIIRALPMSINQWIIVIHFLTLYSFISESSNKTKQNKTKQKPDKNAADSCLTLNKFRMNSQAVVKQFVLHYL